MEYTYLTTDEQAAMREQRCRQLEAEHYSNAMQLAVLEDAVAGGDDSEATATEVERLKQNLVVIEQACDALKAGA